MNIGLHDSDATGFPNLALMKLSAWHKARGDKVEWWNPLLPYDRVYSSKVFTFTPEGRKGEQQVIAFIRDKLK